MSRRRSGRKRPKEDTHGLHVHPVVGAGEGVRVQHVPVQVEEDRDRELPQPDREAGQDMVSEQTRQVQEGGGVREQEQASDLIISCRHFTYLSLF